VAVHGGTKPRRLLQEPERRPHALHTRDVLALQTRTTGASPETGEKAHGDAHLRECARRQYWADGDVLPRPGRAAARPPGRSGGAARRHAPYPAVVHAVLSATLGSARRGRRGRE